MTWLWTAGSIASILALTIVLVDLFVIEFTHGRKGVVLERECDHHREDWAS